MCGKSKSQVTLTVYTLDANLFKDAFLKAQKENEELFKKEEAKEETKEETKEE